MNQQHRHFEKWQILAPIGLTLIGLGASLLGESISRKREGKRWFWLGTLSLICINSGISTFGDAVKERTLYELHNDR